MQERVQAKQQVEDKMKELADIINAPAKYLPVVGESLSEGMFVEIEGRYAITYRLISNERGQVVDFDIAPSLEDLMYYVFSKVTFQMAVDWEVNNRREKEDSRKQLFSKQLDLLKRLSDNYSDRKQKEIESILKIAPYSN